MKRVKRDRERRLNLKRLTIVSWSWVETLKNNGIDEEKSSQIEF